MVKIDPLHSSSQDAAHPPTSQDRAGETLPDLSRLSISGNNGAGTASANGLPSASIQDALPAVAPTNPTTTITINAHASSVTINTGPVVHPDALHPCYRALTATLTALPPTRRRLQPDPVNVQPVAPAVAAAIPIAAAVTPDPPAAGNVQTVPACAATQSPVYNEHDIPPVPAAAAGEIVLPSQDGLDAGEFIAPPDPSARRWYVVTVGLRVGIWREWTDMSNYVYRVPGNSHQHFQTRAEAEYHYYTKKANGEVFVVSK